MKKTDGIERDVSPLGSEAVVSDQGGAYSWRRWLRERNAGFWDHPLISTRHLITAFTVVMGITLLTLAFVLSAGPDPSWLPFPIQPVGWGDAASTAAQFSIFFTFLSFITANVLLLRISLCLSFAIGIFSFWISPPPLHFSFMLWYFAILLINMRHVAVILYDRRHITFDADREDAYTLVFKEVLTRNSFKTLASPSLIRVVNKGRNYIKVGDPCENLTLLLSGRIKKIDTTGKVSFVNSGQFIDSPEWIMRTEAQGQRFNISFDAETECRLLVWPREMLNDLLGGHPDLERSLLGCLGIDVSRKVFLLDVVKSVSSLSEAALQGEGAPEDAFIPPGQTPPGEAGGRASSSGLS